MHILFISDNFYPEVNAPASRTYEHSIRWVKEGCKVTVITCSPNFPEGKVYPGYKNKWYQREQINGITVLRVKTFIAANEGFFLRILDYISFMITSFVVGCFQRSADVIVATSPQFFTACSGWLVSVVRNRPFVFEVRDLWPASIIALGAINNKILKNLLEKFEMFLYRKAAGIITVTEAFKKNISDRGIDKTKIFVCLNGVDLNRFQPILEKDKYLVDKFDLYDKFVIGYIGTHGLAQGLESLLNVAAKIQIHDDIIFILVGSGSEKNKLIFEANKRKISNVVFIDAQSKENIKKYWSICNISLIHLKNIEIFQTVIPSKLFESMGMGLPVLMAMPEGEASQIVEKYNCGLSINSGNDDNMAASILKLKKNKINLEKFKKNALSASLNFSRDNQAKKMLGFLNQLKK